MTVPALLPCPFCGGVNLDADDNFGGAKPFAVCCDVCSFVGPEAATKEGAVSAWNSRPTKRVARSHYAGVAWAVKRLREMIDKAPVGSLSAVAWATAADTIETEAKEGRR